MRRHLPTKDHFVGTTFPFLPNYRVLEHIGSGANGRVYRARADHIDSDLAVKFVPTENLPDDPLARQVYLDEAKKPNTLEHPCVVQYYDVQSWEDVALNRTFFVFICQYVDGLTLTNFIAQHKAEISVGLIENFLATMFGLLFELNERQMVHGDLHGGNVLVSRSRFDLTGGARFRVTDFGIAGLTGNPDGSDYLSVARILKDLLECIDYQQQPARDRYVFDVLRNEFLGRHLIETDVMTDGLATNAAGLHEKLNAVDEMFANASRENTATRMTTPFDYPNCEQIGNAHLLLKSLYSNRLLGLSEIQARSNLVLTGPRGVVRQPCFGR